MKQIAKIMGNCAENNEQKLLENVAKTSQSVKSEARMAQGMIFH